MKFLIAIVLFAVALLGQNCSDSSLVLPEVEDQNVDSNEVSISISQQPEASNSINFGESVVLEVIASTSTSSPLSYKWFKDSVEIQGSISSVHVVADSVLEDSGEYYVEISDSESTLKSSTVQVNIIYPFLKNCSEILVANSAATSGNYMIDPDGPTGEAPFEATCSMRPSGGWTLCAVFGHRKKGSNQANGFNFINTTWNTNGSAFLDQARNTLSYGNFCDKMGAIQNIQSEVRSNSGANNVRFSTPEIMTNNTNPFVGLGSNRFVGAGGVIGIHRVSALQRNFYLDENCLLLTNNFLQGSNICVTDNVANFQMLQGNINNGGNGQLPGDHMCDPNVSCGDTPTNSQEIHFYVK